jgi:geranylgeranyl diphosphate synthase type II
MDNDDVRRGKPTNHKVFGEAVALLAGDGLLTEAFRHLSGMSDADPVSLLKAIHLVGSAAGYQGMVGGQVVDIQSEGKPVDPSLVEFIHSHKTGALIHASVTSGAILAGGTDEQIEAISSYGEKTGLAFQIADDILDIEGDSKTMGKGVGGDARKKKITFPAAVGLQRAKEIQRRMVQSAVDALKAFDAKADPLREIAAYVIERKK